MSAIDSRDYDDPTVEDSLFNRLRRMVTEGHRARSDWRKEASRAFDFVAGHQWSEDDKRLLDDQKRPAVTFNRTAPIIKAVCGLEVNNRQGIVFLPRKIGDSTKNEMYTATAKWMRDECDAADEESEAFRDSTICGEGWIETRSEVTNDTTFPRYIEERVDPLEMGVNKGARKADYSDARMMYRVRDLDPFDAKDMFPGLTAAAIHAKWLDSSELTPADGGLGNKRDYPDETRDGIGFSAGGDPKRCRVVHVQWWEKKPMHMVAHEGDPQVQYIEADKFPTYQERMDALGQRYEHVTVRKRVYMEAFLGASGILTTENNVAESELPSGMFQWRAITGDRDRKKECFYGLLRDMFDPQMWANKWLSQTMQIMNSNAKGGILAETDAFQNVLKAEADWADPTKIVWVKPGALEKNKIKDRIAAPMPQGLNDLMTFALASLRDTTGVNLELLGQADREQAASLEAQRRQSALTILATLFDSLRRFRRNQGRAMLHYISQLPEGTLVRIVEEGQQKYIPFAKDVEANEFDVIVDEAPSSPNQKQAVWVAVMQLMQSGIQLSPPTVIKLLKYSPLPESVVAEIEQTMGMSNEMSAEQLQQRLQQAEQALQVMEEELKTAMEKAKTAEDDRAVDMLKLEIAEYEAETKRLQAMWTARVSALDAQRDAAITPDADEGSGESEEPMGGELSQKVDALAAMMQQLMQTLGGAAQASQQVQPAEFTEE